MAPSPTRGGRHGAFGAGLVALDVRCPRLEDVRVVEVDVGRRIDDGLRRLVVQLLSGVVVGLDAKDFRRDARAFVEEHDLTYKGDLPVNTHGGQLSFGQPGGAGGASKRGRAQSGAIFRDLM